MSRRSTTSLSEHLPYSSHVAPDVVSCRGGELLMSWSLAGLPFQGRDAQALRQWHDNLNQQLLSLKAPDLSNFSIWVHECRRRVRSVDVPAKGAGIPFAVWLRSEYARIRRQRPSFATHWYLTLIYRPNGKHYRQARTVEQCWDHLQRGVARIREFGEGLERGLSECTMRRLCSSESNDGREHSELIGFLNSLAGGSTEPLSLVAGPVRHVIGDQDIEFNDHAGTWSWTDLHLQPRMGAMLHIKEFSEQTAPGILNGLKSANFEYVLTQSFSPLGRRQGLQVLERSKRQLWSAGDKAVSQMEQLELAMDQLSSGVIAMGQYHMSLAVLAESPAALADAVASARSYFTERGMVPVRETQAPLASFLAQFPGNWRFRPRTVHLSSLNFAALASLHGVSTGKASGNPWGDAIATLPTASLQEYHFNFHLSDLHRSCAGELALGNTLVIGKSGTGKTALVNFLLAHAVGLDPAPQIFIFDKDQGSRLFVEAMGGSYVAFSAGKPTGLNPLVLPESAGRHAFLMDWIAMLVGVNAFTAAESAEVSAAIRTVLATQPALRTLSNLRRCLPNRGDDSIHARLRDWTQGHRHGWVFDHGVDVLTEGVAVRAFDYTELLSDDSVRAPVIFYLLHRMENALDGRRTIYVMDEFWKVLEGGGPLLDFVRNKQKTIRKQNGLGVFATQSPEDALRSPIAAALVEQTATMILLPNPGASRQDYCGGLKLSNGEFDLLKSLGERSRSFLIKQGEHCTVCRLDLSGADEMLGILSSDTAAVNELVRLRTRSNLDLADFRLWSGKLRSVTPEPMEVV